MKNDIFSVKKSFKYFYFIALLLLFFSGYYLTEYSGSKYSSSLRFFLLAGVLLLIWHERKLMQRSFQAFIERNNYTLNPLVIVLLLFFIYIVSLSVFFGDFEVIRRSIVLMVFLMVVSVYSATLSFKYSKLIYSLGVFGFFVGVLYLYEYLVLSEFAVFDYRKHRVQSTGFSWLASYDNTITAALHISFLFVAALWGLFNSKRKVSIVFFYITFFILLAAVFVTSARTAWIAIATSLLVFLLFEIKRNKLKVLSVYSVLVVLALFYLSLFYSLDFARGLTHRDTIWLGLLSNLENVRDWVFGAGPAASVSFVKLPNNTYAVHAHNIYVETIYRNGLLGLVLFLSLVLLSVREFILSASKKEAVFFIAIICSGSVAMFFDFSNLIYSPNLVWLWLWFPVAVSLSVRKKVT